RILVPGVRSLIFTYSQVPFSSNALISAWIAFSKPDQNLDLLASFMVFGTGVSGVGTELSFLSCSTFLSTFFLSILTSSFIFFSVLSASTFFVVVCLRKLYFCCAELCVLFSSAFFRLPCSSFCCFFSASFSSEEEEETFKPWSNARSQNSF